MADALDRVRRTVSSARRGRAPPPPAPTQGASIYDLKVPELRTLLREAGLSDKGLKAELQQRLVDYNAARFTSPRPAAAPGAAFSPAPDVSQLEREQVTDRLDALGLETDGTIRQQRIRLQKHYDDEADPWRL